MRTTWVSARLAASILLTPEASGFRIDPEESSTSKILGSDSWACAVNAAPLIVPTASPQAMTNNHSLCIREPTISSNWSMEVQPMLLGQQQSFESAADHPHADVQSEQIDHRDQRSAGQRTGGEFATQHPAR